MSPPARPATIVRSPQLADPADDVKEFILTTFLDLSEMKTAHRSSGKTRPMPQETNVLGYCEEFSSEEFETISRGLIPQDMDDKWFIYLEGNTLNLHRSWTGICIYQVEFATDSGNHTVRRALVNRDRNQYGGTDGDYDSKFLHFLISNLLLGKQVEFPMPTGVPGEIPKGAVQHEFSGTAYPEKPAEATPWWKFW